ncbi:hypothetical protein GGI35DRAFT_480289 [Trichoderma velutinum]
MASRPTGQNVVTNEVMRINSESEEEEFEFDPNYIARRIIFRLRRERLRQQRRRRERGQQVRRQRERRQRETLTAHRRLFIDGAAAPPVSNPNMEALMTQNVAMPPSAVAASLEPPAPPSATAAAENIFMNARGRVRNYDEAFEDPSNGVTSGNHGFGTPRTAHLEMDPVAAAYRQGRAEGQAETMAMFIAWMNSTTASINALRVEMLRQRQ